MKYPAGAGAKVDAEVKTVKPLLSIARAP